MIKSIHHVTATVSDAQEDYDFYTELLGLRLVKKTVNFDNHSVYHFYYANEFGSPGTIMTTFPYKGQNVRQGTIGQGQVGITQFSIGLEAMDFWRSRLNNAKVGFSEHESFGNPEIRFRDPSGLWLALIGNQQDTREAWQTNSIEVANGIKGFFGATAYIEEVGPTFKFLEGVMGFVQAGQQGDITRFVINGGGPGNFLDIQSSSHIPKGRNGIGTVHHIAWAIANQEDQLSLRKKLTEEMEIQVTEVKDRKYFKSIYFRIPGGVLFEVATIGPGFAVDEAQDQLGEQLMLPDWEEVHRAKIEASLPEIVA